MRVFAALVGDSPNTLPQIEDVIKQLLGVATGIVGLAMLVMFVVGAFQYLLAGSNQEAAQKAKNTFTYAALGGAAIIFIWLVFVFLKEFTGIDLLKFSVCIKEDQFCFRP